MSVPPKDPWHRTYWGRLNRPYPGCGFVYIILTIVLVTTLCLMPFGTFVGG